MAFNKYVFCIIKLRPEKKSQSSLSMHTDIRKLSNLFSGKSCLNTQIENPGPGLNASFVFLSIILIF